ncbi:hypothetical protein PAMC26577_32505 [Caballeronia sordidicola]|uniref:Uncharacterized protein n=1 Tax=Caballeronia sordidicola TaxID=196367 RepID=A0A242MC44_CABSO|nr:hypothetical protein PAMC26577_32505 [Caballeronia sordidicola]
MVFGDNLQDSSYYATSGTSIKTIEMRQVTFQNGSLLEQ